MTKRKGFSSSSRFGGFLASAAVCSLCFFGGGLGPASLAANEDVPPRPNIVFIMADDLGYHDLGAYGQDRIKTPHLDALAQNGTRFTDVYAGSTVCAPSRSSLITGQHTGHTTIRGNFPATGGVKDVYGNRRLPLPDEDVTIAEVLKQAGYVTGMTGKWGLGEAGTSGEPNLQGFDEWFGYLNQKHAHDYYPTYQWHNGKRVEIEKNQNGGRRAYSHDLHTDFALDFLRDAGAGEEPFFFHIAYQIPHAKYEIPSVAPYEDRDWPASAKVHAAMITRMDRDVGRVLALLDELELSDETIVFFTSDNGAAERWEGIFNSSHPLRGRKRDLYEGGIRVPMIVSGPGIPSGAVSDAPWYFPDVMPTLAELAGVPEAVPQTTNGVSVAKTLQGGEQPELRERAMYWEFFERGFDQAIRLGEWKAVRNGDQPLELYHLPSDIGETNDVANEHPELVASLEERLVKERTPSAAWPSPIDKEE